MVCVIAQQSKSRDLSLETLAFTLVAGVLGSVVLFLNFLVSDLCGTHIMSETYSPDKKLKAVVFERDCGATTPFVMQVSILNTSDSLPNEPGNVFVEDGGHKPNVSLEVEAIWESENALLIHHDPEARVFGALDELQIPFSGRTVKIRYAEQISRSSD